MREWERNYVNYRNLNIKKIVVIQKNKQPLILTMKYGNISVTQLK